MSYLAPIHRSTSVQHAVKLSLVNSEEECLVLAKANRIEIYNRKDDGLVLFHTRTIYGKILMLDKLRPGSSATDHLFVGTDRYVYFTVFWDSEAGRLRTEKSFVDQADKSARDSETYDRCLIDPLNQFMALFLYDGIVSILPLSSKGKKKSGSSSIDDLGDPVQTRINALFIKAAIFLHIKPTDKSKARLALLYEDSHQKVCLTVRDVEYTAAAMGEPGIADLDNELAFQDDIELGASHLIPVPAPVYGLLILAQTEIIYFNNPREDPIIKALNEATQFVAWTPIDDARWLLADDFGKLYLLMLMTQNSQVVGWQLDNVGETSRASVLVYLGDGHLFVGSHQGDSQVVKIQHAGSEITQAISNIAPILDFTIMDMGRGSTEGQTNEYSSGQARIVTGSGVFKDGSLRSVRSGVGLEEQGILGEMNNPTDIFALRSSSLSSFDDVLVVSFVNETRIFLFAPNGDVEEQASFKSLTLSENTMLVSMLPNGDIIQVLASSVRLIDGEDGMVKGEWSDLHGQPVTSASANSKDLVVSLGGTDIVTFRLDGDLVPQARQLYSEGQIACVYVPDLKSGIAFIGFWQHAEVAIIDTTDLRVLSKIQISEDTSSIPRSLLLERLVHTSSTTEATLLVSAAGGEVITFALDLNTFQTKSRKVTILGTQQANLKRVPRADTDLSNVFATCEHPSLIYGSDDRIVFSAVTAENATAVCYFNAEFIPGAIAIATSTDVRIAIVDTERTTHVQSLHVGELVRRIAYSPVFRAFGMGTIHRLLVGTEEVIRSHFKLTDEIQFKELDTYDLNPEELVESVIRAEINEGGSLVERFVVGTTYVEQDSDDSTRGRILVLAVTGERRLKLITSLPVKGACRTLGCIDGVIVAGLVKTVVLYAMRNSRLEKLCAYRTSTAPIDLAIHAPTKQIAIADLMKSMSIVTWRPPDATKPSNDSHKLEETGRHFQTAWSTAVARVGDDTWLESDAEGNLMVLFQDQSALSEDDKRRLRMVSHIRLGEMVNRIRPVTINALPTAPVIPKALMATVEGGVYLYGQIAQPYLDILISLQSELAPLVESLGHVPFNSFRAFKNQVIELEEPMRFVDGELVERFLDIAESEQENIVRRLGDVANAKGGLNGIREMVETLRRLH